MTQSPPVKTFEELFAELSDRARTRPEGSGTVAALDAGVHTLGKKLLEEAGEVWIDPGRVAGIDKTPSRPQPQRAGEMDFAAIEAEMPTPHRAQAVAQFAAFTRA